MLNEVYIFLISVVIFVDFCLLLISSLYFIRNRKFKKQNIPIYEPPDNLPPVALSVMLDGRVETRDIVAEIIDLTIKGFITIQKSENQLLFSRNNIPTNNLRGFEIKILDTLFNDSNVVSKDSLVTSSVQTLISIQSILHAYIKGEIYPKYYDIRRAIIVSLGYFMGFSCFFLMFLISEYFFLLFLIGIILILISFMLSRFNNKGELLSKQIYGFIDYLKTAELDRLEYLNNPKQMPENFDKLLPYAISLGLEKSWSKMFGEFFNSDQQKPLLLNHGKILNFLHRKIG